MAAPDDRRYTETHEWHQLNNSIVTIGLSKFAVDELTDITYLEILHAEGSVHAGDAIGEIESVKATSELYSSVDGQITQINQAVIDNPALVNEDPYDKGWLVKIKITVRRDGTVIGHSIVKKSGLREADLAVEKVIERVRKFEPFYAGMKGQQQTFDINFVATY